jgi:predicted nucleic-acid-binding Zn-ribbon protein
LVARQLMEGRVMVEGGGELEHGAQAMEWFAAKGVRVRCTQCGGEEFGGGHLIPLYVPSLQEERSEDVRGYTALPIMCKNCGHFELFSADLMGLTPQEGA